MATGFKRNFRIDELKTYWKNKILSSTESNHFNYDFVKSTPFSKRKKTIECSIPADISEKINQIVNHSDFLEFSFFLSAVLALNYKYTGRNKISILTPIYNQHFDPNVINNMLLLNSSVNHSKTFKDLLIQTRQEVTEAIQNQNYSLAPLLAKFKVPFNGDDHPFFDIAIAHEKIHCREYISSINHNIFFLFLKNLNNTVVRVEYNPDLYTEKTITDLLNRMQIVLKQCSDRIDSTLGEICLVTKEEHSKLLFEFNNTDRDFSDQRTLHQVFEAQAANTPENIALVYKDTQLTYKALNEKANQVARRIRTLYQQKTQQGLKPDSFVGLCMEKSPEMIIGILAILKAGSAYVPIDPSYPQERTDYILTDTRAALILCRRQSSEHYNTRLPIDKVLCIDLTEELYAKEDTTNLPPITVETDLAYVCYTSGTTGRPKGVMIEQRSVANYFNNVKEILLPDVINVDFSTSLTFDLTVTTTICSLLLGKKIFIYPGELRDIDQYVEHLVNNKIDFIKSTPSLLANLAVENFSNYKIKQAFIGGEKLENAQLAHILKYVDHPFDEYGPTETTVGASYADKSLSNNHNGIGKPYLNYKFYVFDEDNMLVPIGVVGELYIGGAGVARRYLNNDTLTAERFVSNPFATEDDKSRGYTRLYKTGDLVRWLQDGSLEYIGRNDSQVKIRGYRVELGEIEHCLNQIPHIKQSCVLAKERKTESGIIKYLVGYFVQHHDSIPLSHDAILGKLSATLPEYMVPSALVALQSIPLTLHGKLDVRALPEPDFNSPDQYVAPATNTEIVLCGIWREVLGLEKIGTTDDFFKIGGDSIMTIQVASRIRQAGFNCQVKDVFLCKTIAKLAVYLNSNTSQNVIKSEQGLLSGPVGLLPIQQWFVERVNNGELAAPHHWNHSFLIRVPALDQNRLSPIIEKLAAYHDVLRIQYKKGIKWEQVYQTSALLPKLKYLDVRQTPAEEIHQILTDWQRGFDLEKGPLFQIGYLYGYEDGSARIFMALHHMIVDGVSWRILSDDIKTLYAGKPLPGKGTSYRQWVDCIKGYPERYPEEASYWKFLIDGMPGNTMPQSTGESRTFLELDRSLTSILLQKAPQTYRSDINDLLLTALAYSLCDINGHRTHGITLEGHGREISDPLIDNSHTTGWFTVMFPVKLQLKSSIKESIRHIKETLRMIPNKGIGFGALATDGCSGFTYDNLPLICFNYLGQVGTSTDDWHIVLEDSGRSMHPANTDRNIISINCATSNGKIEFHIITKLGNEITSQLADSLKSHLTAIVRHCEERLETEGSSYTPSDFKYVRLNQAVLDQLCFQARSLQNEVAYIYPANSLQQGFVYHALSQTEDEAYRVQMVYDYHQSMDVSLYIKAWHLCIERFPILRTAFNWEGDLIQIIYKHGRLAYELHDISDTDSKQEQNSRVESIRAQDRKKSFDLTKPTLLRIHIIKQAEDHYTVVKTAHHSISDGWSEPILLNATHQYYELLTSGEKLIIEEDRAYLETQEYIQDHKVSVEQYWEKILTAVSQVNNINVLFSKPIELSTYKSVVRPVTKTIEITKDTYKSLKIFAQREGITLNVVIQFLWHKLLQTYLNSNQTIVGTTISGRELPVKGIEQSAGLYINTLPLILDWENDTILAELHKIQQKTIVLNTHSFPDLAKMQKDGERLFHSLLVFENYPIPPHVGTNTPRISLRNYAYGVDYPLCVVGFENNDAVTIQMTYDGEYLSETKAQHILEELMVILNHVLEKPNQLHKQIKLLHAEKYRATFPSSEASGNQANVQASIAVGIVKRDSDTSEAEASTYVQPTFEVQAAVCKIWQDVLNIKKVGITDDFFKSGGNSILVMHASHRMSKLLKSTIKVADIFKHKTIENILANCLGPALVNIPKTDCNPSVLSFAQERLWFIEQYEEGTNAYHVPAVFELHSTTDVAAIKHALRQIVSRHEILRSTIEYEANDLAMQIVHEEPLCIEELRLTDQDDETHLIADDINRPFNLVSEYPIRVKIYQIESTTHPLSIRKILLINIHHIAIDGWSVEIFQRELLAFYKSYVNGDKEFMLPALDIQYRDYAVWERSYLRGEILEKQLRYWKDKLSGFPTLKFPVDYARRKRVNYAGATEEFTLPMDVSQKLSMLAIKHGTTLHSVMLASFNVLLSKYTGQEDIITGSASANRNHRQTENLIGFFNNTQVNRCRLTADQSFDDLILQVHHDQIAAQLHQDLPFEKLVDELGVERDPSKHPIFQIFFAVQSFGNDPKIREDENRYFKRYEGVAAYSASKLDLSIYIDNSRAEFTGQIVYATSLFSKETIQRLICHYCYLLSQLAACPDKVYSRLNLLPPDEFEKIVYHWNATGKDFGQNGTIHELFEKQVARTPDNFALAYEGSILTYKELNERSNQLARFIRTRYREKTKKPLLADVPIALYLPRSLEMVIGMLGVLKSGAAYVPIDIAYPQERIDFILNDIGCAFALCLRNKVPQGSGVLPDDRCLYMDFSEVFYLTEEVTDLPSVSGSRSLAYVIYTSGTTGKPKGVMIEHRGVINLLYNQIEFFNITSHDKVLQFASYVFDASVSEIFTVLTSGAQLCILPDHIKHDAHRAVAYLKEERISIATLPPVYLSAMPFQPLPHLKTIIVAGEACSSSVMDTWSNGRKIINGYGPTENTVCISMHTYKKGNLNTNIGKPAHNVKVYVLDTYFNPVPIGVIGQLHVGGMSLCRGYWNQPGLASKYFVSNPFVDRNDVDSSTLYRTGDFVRWLANGDLEFIGRNDDQVKIRGHRIELGEIENALSRIEGISQSCVVTRERETENGMTPYLVAYYVPNVAHVSAEWIASKLSDALPSYMIPSSIVSLESLPITINGKLDREALPAPQFESTPDSYKPPISEIEKLICAIWQQALSVEKVGVTDDFFKLGGNSISAIQISHLMSDALHCDISVADVFDLKTIHSIMRNVDVASKNTDIVEWDL